METQPVIGFDIGGTNLRAALIVDGTIVDLISEPTPTDATVTEDIIVDMVETLSRQQEVAAVGLAVAGFLDPDCESIGFAPHLPWRNRNLREVLEQRLQLPVRLEHDANSAAWGEYRFGAAQNVKTWVFFGVGTGIGATLMHNGEIYRGAFGTAPEFGHLTVVPRGRPCSCGKFGCLERYASGTALEDTARELAPRFPDSSLLIDDSPQGTTIVAAAREGDSLGRAIMEDFGSWLGRGLSFVVDVLDPELIVVGGGMAEAADTYLDTATAIMSEEIVGSGHRQLPGVVTAELGPEAGMIGVADLATKLL